MVSPEYRHECESLRVLGEQLKAAEQESLPREKAIAALQAVIEFVNSVALWENENPALTLVQLLGALNDLKDGRVGSMVAPTEGFDNRKPDPSWLKVERAWGIVAVDILAAAGMKIEEACKFVANEFERANIPTGGRPTTPAWRTIKNWRDGVTKLNRNDQLRHTLEVLRVEAKHQFPKEMSIEQKKKALSDKLRRGLPRIHAALE